MTTEKGVILFLVCYSLVREIIFHVTTQKLINKLMSKNFHDYQYVKNLKPAEEKQASANENDLDFAEDLGSLAGIG